MEPATIGSGGQAGRGRSMLESRLGQIVRAALLCLLMFVPCLALAQELDEDAVPRWRNDDPVNIRQQVAQIYQRGLFLYQNGHFTEALPLAQRALTIVENGLAPDHPVVATAMYDVALVYGALGRYADAEPLLKRALAIREKALGPADPVVGMSLNSLALVYETEGRYVDAERLFKRSLVILEKARGPDHPNVATTLGNLASLYRIQGRYVDAERLFKRSLVILEKALGPDHPNVATALNNLALHYADGGRYADAEPLQKRALAIQEKALGPDHPNVATALNNLAELYRNRGRYADAEPLYRRSLAISEKALGPDHPNVAVALNNLAGLYGIQRRYADAEPLYKRSWAISERALGPDHPNVALALKNLADNYRNQGRYAEAEPLYKRSWAIAEKALGPNHPSILIGLNDLAALYQAQGRYADALSILKRNIPRNFANKSIAFAALRGAESRSLIPPREAMDTSYAVLQRSVSSAAGEAISKLAVRFAAGTNELAQLVRNGQDLTAEIARLDKSIDEAVSKPPKERNPTMERQIRKRIDEIRLEITKLQDVLTQRYPEYVALSKPQPLTVEQTQTMLADDEALVAIDLDLKKGYVWVITKDQAEWKDLSISAQDVSKEIEALRSGLDPNARKPFDPALAYQLYRQLLEPIEMIITQKKRLSFVFDGALTSLPPHVLITSDPGNKDFVSLDWLVRKYAVTVLPSVASLKVLRGQQSVAAAPKPMIGFGDPVFDRTAQRTRRPKITALNRSLTSFYRGAITDTTALGKALPPVPETADELREVARLLGAKPDDIKLGEDATVTDVKHERLYDYRVVYFATHALVAGEVEKFAHAKAEPALVLSIPARPSEEDNGLLTASEVATLKLNADFVVLSACNTAAGDKPGAEALSGLARAFFYAGAKSLVVSHWTVDSEATVKLMDGLFAALKANPGLSHAEALRSSMLQMIDNPEWAQPSLWAPFVIVGEPKK
jgi:CHAT domain-containing protein/Tfp pilus assembly protein PilF